ncbi:GrpB family protein [Candidatus Blastococcus massiliensis]|uniref:GrpB family protein n=1 Tax=Candidatus Blastococcus massiliensis TaxID=1470358 RepID=UPI00141219B4|nr:GrpB family protein [Candidatus Blastococcus massiliensis]
MQVRESQKGWQRRGEQLCRQLDVTLAPWLVASVEHVGSTAVPGLAAKPITDVQAAVLELECADTIADVVAPFGWHLVPAELDARPWRRLLVQVVDEHRAAHLHLLPAGSARWSEQLAFRDALRADPVLVHRYADLKRTLAAQHAADREAYTAGKAGFVRSVLERSSPRRK